MAIHMMEMQENPVAAQSTKLKALEIPDWCWRPEDSCRASGFDSAWEEWRNWRLVSERMEVALIGLWKYLPRYTQKLILNHIKLTNKTNWWIWRESSALSFSVLATQYENWEFRSPDPVKAKWPCLWPTRNPNAGSRDRKYLEQAG